MALSVTKLIGLRLRRLENRLKNLVFRTIRERTVAVLLEFLGRQTVVEVKMESLTLNGHKYGSREIQARGLG